MLPGGGWAETQRGQLLALKIEQSTGTYKPEAQAKAHSIHAFAFRCRLVNAWHAVTCRSLPLLVRLTLNIAGSGNLEGPRKCATNAS